MNTDGTQIVTGPKDYAPQPVTEQLIDLPVTDKIIVELKTDVTCQSVHEARVLKELRGTGVRLGFLVTLGGKRWSNGLLAASVFHLCKSVAK